MCTKRGVIMSELYKKIQNLCDNRGVNVTQMCKATSVSRGSLTDLKSGRIQSLSTESLSKIATYFGVTIEELLNGNSESKSTVSTSPAIENDNTLDRNYFSLAKEMQDEEIDPDDIRNIIKMMKNMRKSK